MSGLLDPTDAAALCGVDAQREVEAEAEAEAEAEREVEAEAEAAAKTAHAETADTRGSRLHGVERGATLEAFFLRYKAAPLVVLIAAAALGIFGSKIHPTAGVIYIIYVIYVIVPLRC